MDNEQDKTSICENDEKDSDEIGAETNNSNISKRQLKRMKKRELWLEKRKEKRVLDRLKAKEKKACAKANKIDLGPSRKELKRSRMARSTCSVTVSIDLSFDDLMMDKDIAKLIKQILRCYSLNRRSSAPMQFSCTSFTGKSRQQMEKHNGYSNWDVTLFPESYDKVYPKDKIVYLTSESDEIIETLLPDHVYIIGGLVDHNSKKGLCHKLAVEKGVKHGQLPLGKYLKMSARKVLTIDHVFEILLRVTEGKSWQEAFLQVLPERKNARLVETDETNDSDDVEQVPKKVKTDDTNTIKAELNLIPHSTIISSENNDELTSNDSNALVTNGEAT